MMVRARGGAVGLLVVGLVGCIEDARIAEDELEPDGSAFAQAPGEPRAEVDAAGHSEPSPGPAFDAETKPDRRPVDAAVGADVAVVVDAGAGPDAAPADAAPGPPLDRCEAALARFRDGEDGPFACDDWAVAECGAQISECCWVYAYCADGFVERSVTCDDSCAQGCSTYAARDCALDPYCAWFDSGACGPAPEGVIEGPVCAPRRGVACSVNGECEQGQRCQGFLIDPCAGSNCDACGGVAGYCVW